MYKINNLFQCGKPITEVIILKEKRNETKPFEKDSFRKTTEYPVSVFYNAAADFLGTDEVEAAEKSAKKNGDKK